MLLVALDLSGWALYRAMLRASPDRRSNYHVVLDVSYTRYCRFMTIKGAFLTPHKGGLTLRVG